jgi:hypothetical protein
MSPPGMISGLAFDQPNVASARALGRFLDLELDPLTLTQELENGAANRAAVKEVLDPGFVSNETEPLVDQKASDGTRRHTRVLREHSPRAIPGAQAGNADGPEESGPL